MTTERYVLTWRTLVLYNRKHNNFGMLVLGLKPKKSSFGAITEALLYKFSP